MQKDPAAPLMLSTGDTIKVHCQWNNTTRKTLTFGFEMCVGFGQYVDDTGLGNQAWDGASSSWGSF